MAGTIGGPRTDWIAQSLHRKESAAVEAVLVHNKLILKLGQSY